MFHNAASICANRSFVVARDDARRASHLAPINHTWSIGNKSGDHVDQERSGIRVV